LREIPNVLEILLRAMRSRIAKYAWRFIKLHMPLYHSLDTQIQMAVKSARVWKL